MRGHGDKGAQCVGTELSSVKGQWAGFLPGCLVPSDALLQKQFVSRGLSGAKRQPERVF